MDGFEFVLDGRVHSILLPVLPEYRVVGRLLISRFTDSRFVKSDRFKVLITQCLSINEKLNSSN